MKNRKPIILMCLIFSALLWSGTAAAQQGLHIESVFQKYGKSKGSVMTVLNHEMLEAYQMKLYKSLSIRTPSPEVRIFILRSLAQDKKGAKNIKEVVQNGIIQSGYYQLPQITEDVNRFILYKESAKKVATLIYIEGELDADDLITLLFMKQ